MLTPYSTRLHFIFAHLLNIDAPAKDIYSSDIDVQSLEAQSDVGNLLGDIMGAFQDGTDADADIVSDAASDDRSSNPQASLKQRNSVNAELIKRLMQFASDRAAPVSTKTQKRVKVPDGLRLNKWIHKPAKERAIAARTAIVDERKDSGASHTKGSFSLANVSLTENAHDINSDEENQSPRQKSEQMDKGDSSDEFAAFRSDNDDSSGDEISTQPQRNSIFYLGNNRQKGKNPKKTKKKKKNKQPKENMIADSLPQTTTLSNVFSAGLCQHLIKVPEALTPRAIFWITIYLIFWT